MRYLDYMPRQEAVFCTWLAMFFAYLSENLLRFGIAADVFAPLTALRTDFEEKYVVATAPSTRTKAAVLAKNEALDALKTALRAFVREYLTYNHLVSDADRENMGLPVHKASRTPHPVPSSCPVFTIDTSIIRRLGIHFRDSEGERKAKPFGVHGVEIKWGFSEDPVVNPTALVYSAFDTRSPFHVEFQGEERGRKVWFCLRWENTKGEKGPWSEIISAIVP